MTGNYTTHVYGYNGIILHISMVMTGDYTTHVYGYDGIILHMYMVNPLYHGIILHTYMVITGIILHM